MYSRGAIRDRSLMANDEIKVGDVVRLRSGGPRMTVVNRRGENNAWVECQWFDDKKQVTEKGFIVDALTLANDDIMAV